VKVRNFISVSSIDLPCFFYFVVEDSCVDWQDIRITKEEEITIFFHLNNLFNKSVNN
jgi:hypothetical protein